MASRLRNAFLVVSAGLLLFGCVPITGAPYGNYYPSAYPYGAYGAYPYGVYGSAAVIDGYGAGYYGGDVGYFGAFGRGYGRRFGRGGYGHFAGPANFGGRGGHGYGGYSHGGGGFHGGGFHGGGGGHGGGGHGGGGGGGRH